MGNQRSPQVTGVYRKYPFDTGSEQGLWPCGTASRGSPGNDAQRQWRRNGADGPWTRCVNCGCKSFMRIFGHDDATAEELLRAKEFYE